MTKERPGELNSQLERPSGDAHRGAAGAPRYEFRVRERLEHKGPRSFEELEVRSDVAGGTTLSGALADQAALHGVIARIRDLNLTLLSVRLVEEVQDQIENERNRE